MRLGQPSQWLPMKCQNHWISPIVYYNRASVSCTSGWNIIQHYKRFIKRSNDLSKMNHNMIWDRMIFRIRFHFILIRLTSKVYRDWTQLGRSENGNSDTFQKALQENHSSSSSWFSWYYCRYYGSGYNRNKEKMCIRRMQQWLSHCETTYRHNLLLPGPWD